VLVASAYTLSVVAVIVAAASLFVSALQATIKWREFRHRREARIAIDPVFHATADHWEVELWLTNVGSNHARLVRAWLEDEHGQRIGEEHRLPRPLLSGAPSERVKIIVPKNGRQSLNAWPVRRWRDARQAHDSKPDRSDQMIRLEG
jgi:hypothetical protein